MLVGILVPPKHHVTVTWHAHEETLEQYKRAVAVTSMVAVSTRPFDITFPELGVFEPSGAWHAKVESKELMLLNKNLGALMDVFGVEYSKEYDYKPHATITYFKKPKVNPFEGLTFRVEYLTVVSTEHGNTNIKL